MLGCLGTFSETKESLLLSSSEAQVTFVGVATAEPQVTLLLFQAVNVVDALLGVGLVGERVLAWDSTPSDESAFRSWCSPSQIFDSSESIVLIAFRGKVMNTI